MITEQIVHSNKNNQFEITVFILGSLYFLYLIFYFVKTWNLHKPLCLYISIIGFLASIMWLKIKIQLKADLSKLLILIIFSVFSAEAFIEVEEIIIKRSLVPVQKVKGSNTSEIIKSLRSKGLDVWPNIGGMRFIQEEFQKGELIRLMPLGAISCKPALYLGDPEGKQAIVNMDEHGFNNEKGLYKKNEIEIVLIGACMWEHAGLLKPEEDNIGAILRRMGYKALNLSKQGNQSASQYSIIREYAKPLEAKAILFLVRNDISIPPNISQMLEKYIEDEDFSQNLISRQKEIDHFLITFFNKQIYKNKESADIINTSKTENDKKIEEQTSFKHLSINKILTLSQIKRKVILPLIKKQLLNFNAKTENKEKKGLYELKKIILMSNQQVRNWGGKFYIVYQPQKEHFIMGIPDHFCNKILSFAKKNNISIIDMNKEVFSIHSDPLSLLPYRENPHVNEKAHKLMAEAIAKRLINDGILQK